jgi:archaellum component FlaG (FlaF/FlaG flagellin family)
MNPSRRLMASSNFQRWPLFGLCALFLAGAGQAQSLAPPPEDSMWLAASNKTLDQLRGGFDFGGGLVVSFGISRAVFINGQMVASTSFQVGDMTKLTSAQTEALSQQISTQAQVVQNGPGNRVDAGAGTVPFAVYIQNTQNNQTLRSQTVIDVASNGLSLVKHLNLQATLNDSIHNAVGNR